MVKDRGGVGWGVRCGVRGIQMEYEVEVEWEVYEEYGVWCMVYGGGRGV